MSDTSYVQAYNLITSYIIWRRTIADEVCQISRLYDLFPAQSIRLKTAKLLKNKNREIVVNG